MTERTRLAIGLADRLVYDRACVSGRVDECNGQSKPHSTKHAYPPSLPLTCFNDDLGGERRSKPVHLAGVRPVHLQHSHGQRQWVMQHTNSEGLKEGPGPGPGRAQECVYRRRECTITPTPAAAPAAAHAPAAAAAHAVYQPRCASRWVHPSEDADWGIRSVGTRCTASGPEPW